MSAPRPTLYQRITASVPLMVTIIVHVVLIGIAGYFVVSEQIIKKGKVLEAANASQPSVAQKQVEHRLQVARKAGGSSSSSPVSASRIFSNAENALQMPAMPELPSVGASSMSGMGFGKGIGAAGTGSGYGTGLSAVGGSGVGFVNMSFLGVTNQRISKVVFIVDVGPDLMDIKKGGFDAFKIIREEIMKLVSRLPPSAEFGVILYDGRWFNDSVTTFDAALQPATVGNKQQFFDWITPVNATPDSLGLASAKGRRVKWTPKDLSRAGIDETLNTPSWARGLHFALEMGPDAIFIISGSRGGVSHDMSDAEVAKRKREHEKNVADAKERYKREGIDLDAVAKAREKAYAKAKAEFEDMNKKLRAAGKNPFIITHISRVFAADFQAEVRKAGFPPIKLDTAGWTDKQGQPIHGFGTPNYNKGADFDELIMHVSKLQRTLSKDRVAVNYFLFVGPNEEPKAAIEDLSKFVSRNGGKFQLLTTKRLQELAKREDAKK